MSKNERSERATERSDEEIILDETSDVSLIIDVLNGTLEGILDYAEDLKADATSVAIHELTLQAIDISLLLREKIGDVTFDLDFELDEDDYEPYSKGH